MPNDAVTITLLGEPVAWARTAGGRTKNLFQPKKQRNNFAALRLLAQEAMTGRTPMEGPVIGHISAEFPVPTSWSRKKQAAALSLIGNIMPTRKPDLSNICKQIEDACNGVVFKDDAQIVSYVTLCKIYSAQPKIVATYLPWR